MKNKFTIGPYLKQKRTEANLTQKEVADEFGYSTAQFVSNWERDVSMPPIKDLKRLGQLYKIPVDELFEVTLKVKIAEITADLTKKFKEAR